MRIQWVILLIFVIYFIWHICKTWIKPMKTFRDYRNRAFEYEISFFPNKRKKEIEILKRALKIEDLTEIQRATLYGDLGQAYYKLKEYDNAVQSFDNALEVILKRDMYYSRIVTDIIEAYYYAGQRDRARELYDNFLQRQSHDARFKKVEKLSSLFDK